MRLEDELDRLRKKDRKRVVWAGIRSALGLGPRTIPRTPDDRMMSALGQLQYAMDHVEVKEVLDELHAYVDRTLSEGGEKAEALRESRTPTLLFIVQYVWELSDPHSLIPVSDSVGREIRARIHGPLVEDQ